ncbi:class I SAM-dependent methyltransferase [Paenibacillus sp. S-38]|uniref:class I SAM-dependent methyltransferase n=1 Tax=Paenibacillus sp. S-38 TaxID=3416710 RepID=UPI003CE68E51
MKKKYGEVSLNLKYYTGQDGYSDGDIENEILEIVKNTEDYTHLVENDERWPILYHLSPIRRNLLEWVPISSQESVLEIGAGCGALTGLMCEKAQRVVAIELSKRRAEINAYRNKRHSNLEILVGNLNDMKINEKFDVVTLVGVLEYAPSFTVDEKPFDRFLSKIKDFILPGKKLIVAIENKYGLKYWAGAKEDHTGVMFDSIQNYYNTERVKTFSKNEITLLLQRNGFVNLKFYYPMPDYKLPTQVFSEKRLPNIGNINGYVNTDSDRLSLFDERLVYNNLIADGQFEFFANSFLVICENGGR